ncbi:MAG: hypothetical protein IJ530_15960 [Treponema sp.]|uniref:hypothetical protein n=1 Tax=Treponema sp. TaxID=166 RepID=UPI0025D57577|nr:hypothetical protein [Treponema sp.]MBQ8681228.1 hypothetical protein [Treponema sp.]MBR1403130.1 hypothetical protein [Treponema sp.]
MAEELESENKGLVILEGLYGKVLSGIQPVSEPLEEFVKDYMTQCNGNKEKAVEKMVNTQIAKLPAKVLTKINQKLGFRFPTKFGSKGAVNLVKVIPVIPGFINAGFNAVETKAIANRAIKEFVKN